MANASPEIVFDSVGFVNDIRSGSSRLLTLRKFRGGTIGGGASEPLLAEFGKLLDAYVVDELPLEPGRGRFIANVLYAINAKWKTYENWKGNFACVGHIIFASSYMWTWGCWLPSIHPLLMNTEICYVEIDQVQVFLNSMRSPFLCRPRIAYRSPWYSDTNEMLKLNGNQYNYNY